MLMMALMESLDLPEMEESVESSRAKTVTVPRRLMSPASLFSAMYRLNNSNSGNCSNNLVML